VKPLLCRTALLVLLLTAAAATAAEPHRHHGAHVHGEATLRVSMDGALLIVVLEAPGMSLLGFEHAPHSEAERTRYQDVLAALKAPSHWLSLPPGAACAQESGDVQPHGFDAQDASAQSGGEHAAQGHAPQEPATHEHADFDATYRYTCRVPLALRDFDVRLFDLSPDLHTIRVELVLPTRQGSQVLTPESSRVRLNN